MKIGNYKIFRLISDDIIPETEKTEQTNFIFIYDRSGSMSGTLSALCEDLIEQAKKIKLGDTLTICWFSGEGRNSCILKGFKISDSKDFQNIEKAIRANNTTIGTTCFSESFINLQSIITDLKNIFSPNIVLCFFTDGYPVVNNYQKEITALYNAIGMVKDNLSATLIIGYGETYNKDLLVEMSQRIGGTVIHNSSLSDTNKTLTDFIENSGSTFRSTIKIPIFMRDWTPIAACSSLGSKIYNIDTGDDSLAWKVSIFGKELYIIYDNGIDSDLEDNEITDKVLYALAASLVQKAKSDIALELLNYLGDKYLMDKIINAFTNGEYGEAEKSLVAAVNNESESRYKLGKATNYLPNDNAFCILDLLFLLMEDDEAKFYPKHESFVYQKIGKSTKVKEGYLKFVPHRNVGVPISSLTWHKEKLNLSILAKIPGCVDLSAVKIGKIPEEVIEFSKGLAEETWKGYPTFQYRNFTIIKNGILNVTKLPFTCSEQMLETLLIKGVKIEAIDNEINLLHLTDIPFINRSLVNNRTSAKQLAEKAIESLRLEAKMKVFNAKNVSEKMITEFPKEISHFLQLQGFREDGSYSPPTEVAKNNEFTDFYMAKTFKIKVKGASAIPKVTDVEKKISTKKKLNFIDEWMKEALIECKTEDIDELQRQTKDELRKLRKYIQETKFALLLAKKWFDEFSSFDNCQITNNGITVSFEIGEEKVIID